MNSACFQEHYFFRSTGNSLSATALESVPRVCLFVISRSPVQIRTVALSYSNFQISSSSVESAGNHRSAIVIPTPDNNHSSIPYMAHGQNVCEPLSVPKTLNMEGEPCLKINPKCLTNYATPISRNCWDSPHL